MKIGIVGNQIGWMYNEVKTVLKKNNVYKSDLIISGGAVGVDTFAQRYAKEIGARILVIYPDLSKPSPECFYHRNKEIAFECDVLIAFDRNKAGSGTKNTIRYAKELGKEIIKVN